MTKKPARRRKVDMAVLLGDSPAPARKRRVFGGVKATAAAVLETTYRDVSGGTTVQQALDYSGYYLGQAFCIARKHRVVAIQPGGLEMWLIPCKACEAGALQDVHRVFTFESGLHPATRRKA